MRPTDDEPVTFRDSVQGHLTDWEWKQVLTPGTDLYNRWCRQVDVIAGYLLELQDAGVLLFRPYHEMNGNWFWWGGRPGPDGSAALYRQIFNRFVHVPEGSAALVRMLYERLATHDGLRNLIWIWEPASPGFGPGGNGGLANYYPGSLYADALTLDVESLAPSRFRADRMLSNFAGGKPVGLRIASGSPAPSVLEGQTGWQWIVLPPPESKPTAAP